MVYSKEEIEDDKKKIEELKAKWSESEIKVRKNQDLLRKLVILLFHKFFGETYVVLGASEYDELVNQVSVMLIAGKGASEGETVFFYVEVIKDKGEIEERMNHFLQRNLKGGVKLKYGCKLVFEKDGERKLVKSPLENVPIFYLALPERILYTAIKKYGSSLEERSEYEEYIFGLLLFLIEHQIMILSRAGSKPELWLSQMVHGWLLSKGMRRVERVLKQFSEGFRNNGFLLNEYCESEMELFEGKDDYKGREKYTAENIKRDIENVKNRIHEIGLEQFLRTKEHEVPRLFSIYLLNKSLGKDFYAIGASMYDRIINEVDIFLISKDKGECVAAFIVELGERGGPGPVYEEKRKRVIERNMKGGAYIKYAFKVVKENGKTYVAPSSQEHVPIYYVAHPEDIIYSAVKEMAISEKISENERILKFFETTNKPDKHQKNY